MMLNKIMPSSMVPSSERDNLVDPARLHTGLPADVSRDVSRDIFLSQH